MGAWQILLRDMPRARPPCPPGTRHSPNVALMLDRRHRRWSNIKPTLGECLPGSNGRECSPGYL